jgi:hypothetical protein
MILIPPGILFHISHKYLINPNKRVCFNLPRSNTEGGSFVVVVVVVVDDSTAWRQTIKLN